MTRFVILLLLGLAIPFSAQAQNDKITPEDQAYLEIMEDTVAYLGYLIINDSLPESRFLACRSLIRKLKTALETPNSFYYPFERLNAVSIQYAPDNSFRIFTWQLFVDNDNYRYYGAIQMNTPELTLIPLIDRSDDMGYSTEQGPLTPEQWYGALYYNIQASEGPNGPYYLLFGYDGYSFFRKRKLIDVLYFKDDKAHFGAPVLIGTKDGEDRVLDRLILEYSVSTAIRLNYDEHREHIIFDHLITLPGRDGEGLTNFPDGSYEAYHKGKDGLWHYEKKVFDQILDEPPVPAPLDQKKGKDILGRNNNR